jgi:hypothetical protein
VTGCSKMLLVQQPSSFSSPIGYESISLNRNVKIKRFAEILPARLIQSSLMLVRDYLGDGLILLFLTLPRNSWPGTPCSIHNVRGLRCALTSIHTMSNFIAFFSRTLQLARDCEAPYQARLYPRRPYRCWYAAHT